MKSRFRLRNRRGVLDAGIIILGGIVAIIAIIAATLAWSDILEVSYINLMTEMPRFGYDIQSSVETGNRNFEIYQILRNIAFVILIFVVMFAGLSFMFEHINLLPQETGYQILSKSLIYVFFFFFFPPLWDVLAATVEQTSRWILNPEDPAQAAKNVDFLLTKLGGIQSPKFTLDEIVSGITNPFEGLQDMFKGVFLSIFKAIAFLIFIFMAFLIGTIRIVLTSIVTVALPVILMLSLLPFFKRITHRFIDALLGLMLAPIFSSLVVVTGVAYIQSLESANPDPLSEWFTALAVMALATTIPALIVPALGSIMGTVAAAVTGAVSAGAITTSTAGLGFMQTASDAFSSVLPERMAGGSINPLNLARMAFSTIGRSAMRLANSGEPSLTPKPSISGYGGFTPGPIFATKYSPGKILDPNQIPGVITANIEAFTKSPMHASQTDTDDPSDGQDKNQQA